MTRVGARILQMFQTSVDKVNIKSQDFQDKHKKMKQSLIKTLNQKQKIDINQLFKIVIIYNQEKIAYQLQKLSKIILFLEEGQRKNQKKLSLQKKRQQPITQIKRQKQKQKINQRIVQLKQQAKQKQKTKKQKNKLAQKMIAGLYSTMDIHKNQFIEDMVCTNPQQKYKKLYDQITFRNRYNKQQINQFQSKKQQFYIKVQKFKEIMLEESRKIQQVVIIKSQPKIFVEQQPQSYTQNPYLSQRQIPQTDITLPQVQVLPFKFTEQRPLRTSIQKAQSPRLVKQVTQFYSMQSTAQVTHHLKFDTKQEQIYLRSNRAKLPQIGRASIDNTVSIPSTKKGSLGLRQKLQRDKDRVNIVTNININGQLSENKKNKNKIQSFSLKKDTKPQNLDLSKQKQKTTKQYQDSNLKSFQYTFYIKKRTNKFYQTKNNFVI